MRVWRLQALNGRAGGLRAQIMDGLEASRQIQARYPPAVRPRIVALSADTLQVMHDRGREVGIEEFICKPFRVEDLQRVLAHVRPPCSPPAGQAPCSAA